MEKRSGKEEIVIMSDERRSASASIAVGIEDQTREKQGRLLAVREVARVLGIHVNTVRMWADCGILDSYRLGSRGDRRIPVEAVMRLLEVAQR